MWRPLTESLSTGSSSTARRLAQGVLLPPESGIDYTEHAPCRAVIWLSLNGFLLLRARSSKSQLRLLLVVCHARDIAFPERTWEMNGVDANGTSSEASKASLAAATSRSASAQFQPPRAICGIAAGFVARMSAIN